jgi:hypothetical protein
MKAGRPLFAALLLPACVGDATARWDLDHDRVVAARFDPPHIASGEVARITGLLAAEGAGTREVDVLGASAPFAPGGLFTAVHFNIDHWQVDGQPDDQLAAARAELGLAANAPVPIDVTLQFPGDLYADKIIYLGDSRANPVVPEADASGTPIDAQLAVAAGETVNLAFASEANERVRWLTSCGSLSSDQDASAELHAGARCTGELAVVVRDDAGGVAWRVWPLQIGD